MGTNLAIQIRVIDGESSEIVRLFGVGIERVFIQSIGIVVLRKQRWLEPFAGCNLPIDALEKAVSLDLIGALRA